MWCLPELGVVGEFAWLFCAATAAACAAFTAVLAAYRLASSWNLPIFFLYRMRLLPNQLDTCVRGEQKKEEEQRSQTSSNHSGVHRAVGLFQDVMFRSIKYQIPSPCSNVRRVHNLIKPQSGAACVVSWMGAWHALELCLQTEPKHMGHRLHSYQGWL